jgi:hypothetical protein
VKGRKPSRNLIFRFITDCILGERASPRMLRLPSEQGPNSMRPCTQPTTVSSASRAAVPSISAASGSSSQTAPVAARKRSISSFEKAGPRKAPLIESLSDRGRRGLPSTLCSNPAASRAAALRRLWRWRQGRPVVRTS